MKIGTKKQLIIYTGIIFVFLFCTIILPILLHNDQKRICSFFDNEEDYLRQKTLFEQNLDYDMGLAIGTYEYICLRDKEKGDKTYKLVKTISDNKNRERTPQ